MQGGRTVGSLWSGCDRGVSPCILHGPHVACPGVDAGVSVWSISVIQSHCPALVLKTNRPQNSHLVLCVVVNIQLLQSCG